MNETPYTNKEDIIHPMRMSVTATRIHLVSDGYDGALMYVYRGDNLVTEIQLVGTYGGVEINTDLPVVS